MMNNFQKNDRAGGTQNARRLAVDEKRLHEKFVKYGANAKAWMRQCVMLLPEIEKRGIWKKKGFGSIYEYAAKLAGMSKNTVDDALRILARIENQPHLRMVAEIKGLGAVRPVLTLMTPDTEYFWARKAAAMSKNTLETYVREFKGQEDLRLMDEHRLRTSFRTKFDMVIKNETNRARPRTDANQQEKDSSVKKVILSMELDGKTAEKLQKLKGQRDWDTLMHELLELREEKLQAEEPEPVVNARRYIPARVRNHVLKKTNGQCAYPGCTKRYQILHHTQRFALQAVHDPRRLVPLCVGHERLAHQGLIEREQGATEDWRLRKEPDRNQVEYAIDRKVMSYRKYNSSQKSCS